jgi:hypothetical protein
MMAGLSIGMGDKGVELMARKCEVGCVFFGGEEEAVINDST